MEVLISALYKDHGLLLIPVDDGYSVLEHDIAQKYRKIPNYLSEELVKNLYSEDEVVDDAEELAVIKNDLKVCYTDFLNCPSKVTLAFFAKVLKHTIKEYFDKTGVGYISSFGRNVKTIRLVNLINTKIKRKALKGFLAEVLPEGMSAYSKTYDIVIYAMPTEKQAQKNEIVGIQQA